MLESTLYHFSDVKKCVCKEWFHPSLAMLFCFLNRVCCTSDNVGNAMQSYGSSQLMWIKCLFNNLDSPIVIAKARELSYLKRRSIGHHQCRSISTSGIITLAASKGSGWRHNRRGESSYSPNGEQCRSKGGRTTKEGDHSSRVAVCSDRS